MLRQRGGPTTTVYNGLGDTETKEEERGESHMEGKERLGFRHWFLILLCIAGVYGVVVCLHRRMPPVLEDTEHKQFSETRARVLLKQLTALGPRPSGSEALEKHAFSIMQSRFDDVQETAARFGVNRVERDVQRPTGCFDLRFLSSFTLCYHKITNLVVRIGPKSGATKQSLLMNCHYDTMPDTPGATDDAVSCAIMMEVLEVLAHSNEPLENDVVFLFNGAEENFLQGAHGFIENHPWRHTIRAFINLEGTGSGGREILFQAGPGNSWLLRTYLEHAPHPHCSVLAQEIFQSGVIPSDTDFRIFRDYGRVSGLDIAYTKNGWVYHTEFDEEWRIEAGAIQRSGENMLAVVKALLSSPYLVQAASFEEQNQWVFYDVVGLFTVCYSIAVGNLVNLTVAGAAFVLIAWRCISGVYSLSDLVCAGWHHVAALVSMLAGMLALVALVAGLDLVMTWYALPELIGPLYVLPLILVGITVHAHFAASKSRLSPSNREMVHADSVLAFFATLLVLMTVCGVASSFFILNYVLFPLLKEPLIWTMKRTGLVRAVSPRVLLYSQLVCSVPVLVFASYAISLSVDFFVPVMGRLGSAVHPEFVIAPLSLVIAYTFVLFTNNLVYVSRRINYMIQCGWALFALFGILLLTTQLGVPYKYSEDAPRLRRVLALHTHRTRFSFSGERVAADDGLFVQSFDYRGAADLPAHSFLQGSSRPNCTGIRDEYCRMPYYTAIHELFPPEESLWVPVPSKAHIPHPIHFKALSKKLTGNILNMTFELTGGYDKMSVRVTPLAGYDLHSWSFTHIDVDEFGRRPTYFVFLTYGFEAPAKREFWVAMQHAGSPHDPSSGASMEMTVASHHAHGTHQASDTMTQLRELIAERRQQPHVAVGWWKWGITLIGGVSEMVTKEV